MDKTPSRPTADQLRALGISQPHAWHLAHGKKLPSLKLAHTIEGATGYPVGAWRLEEKSA